MLNKPHYEENRITQEVYRMAKRCVAYGRVSTNQEKQKTSIESQRAYYEEKFKGDGYLPSPYGMLYRKNGTTEPLPSMYIDEGISGTCITFRKAFEKMLEDAKLGKFDIIYVKSVSRFARNTVDGLKTCEELRAIGVGVFFEDCGLNSIDPENDMTLAVLFSVAQKESQTKSHNVKWGIRQRQKAGKWFCNAHFGYDKIERGLIINEQEAATVRYIFHLYTEEDYSVHGITQLLNKDIEKYPTKQGKVWSRQQISGMLRNSIYVGMYRSHVEEKQGYKATDPVMQVPEEEQYIHELPELRIIDDDTWDKAVQILKAREARYSTVHLKGKNTNRHLLSTMLFCKDCGVAYTRQKRHGGLKKDGTRSDLGYFWGCRNYAQYGTLRCNNKYGINEDEAEKQVREAISQLQQDIREHDGGALLTNFKAYLKIMYELYHEDSSIEAVKAELKKIERKKDIILEDRMEGLMSKELYQKEVKALNEQAEELELRIKSDRMYDETIKQEWSRYNKYIKRVLALDPDSLNNGDLKQVYNKIYVGVADVEGKARPRKYLIFSYSLMGYSVEEIIQMYYDKGYADENTVVNIKIN